MPAIKRPLACFNFFGLIPNNMCTPSYTALSTFRKVLHELHLWTQIGTSTVPHSTFQQAQSIIYITHKLPWSMLLLLTSKLCKSVSAVRLLILSQFHPWSHYGTLSLTVFPHSRSRNSSFLLRRVSPFQFFESTSRFIKSLACTFPIPALGVFQVRGSSDSLRIIPSKLGGLKCEL